MPQNTRFRNQKFIGSVINAGELTGHQGEEGRITYNKDIVNEKSFGHFADIITSIVPLDVVFDSGRNHKLPSLARVL